jgi:hypothetical protein
MVDLVEYEHFKHLIPSFFLDNNKYGWNKILGRCPLSSKTFILKGSHAISTPQLSNINPNYLPESDTLIRYELCKMDKAPGIIA